MDNDLLESEGRKMDIEEFCTEKTLTEILEIKKEDLEKLRKEENFPYIKLTEDKRIYFLPHVVEWLLSQEKNLNSAIVKS